MRFKTGATLAAVAAATFIAGQAHAQELDMTKKSSYDQIISWANEPLDTSKFKKDGDLKIGVSAGYLSNASTLR